MACWLAVCVCARACSYVISPSFQTRFVVLNQMYPRQEAGASVQQRKSESGILPWGRGRGVGENHNAKSRDTPGSTRKPTRHWEWKAQCLKVLHSSTMQARWGKVLAKRYTGHKQQGILFKLRWSQRQVSSMSLGVFPVLGPGDQSLPEGGSI